MSPSFVSLEYAQKILKNSPIEVVAQNMHYEEKGAFTGEISYKMLKSINVNSVIIGHSERRTLFYENDDTIKRKIKTALHNEMKVIFCFGESLEDRKEKRHIKIISKQLDVIMNDLKINQWNQKLKKVFCFHTAVGKIVLQFGDLLKIYHTKKTILLSTY